MRHQGTATRICPRTIAAFEASPTPKHGYEIDWFQRCLLLLVEAPPCVGGTSFAQQRGRCSGVVVCFKSELPPAVSGSSSTFFLFGILPSVSSLLCPSFCVLPICVLCSCLRKDPVRHPDLSLSLSLSLTSAYTRESKGGGTQPNFGVRLASPISLFLHSSHVFRSSCRPARGSRSEDEDAPATS